MKALQTVAKVMGEKYDINIKFEGKRANTDGKTITLPALPDVIDDRILTITRGYCDHETGHIKYSDFLMLNRIQAMVDAGRIKNVTNLLEDLRVEKLMAARYLGVKENLTLMADEIFKD